MPNTQSMKSFCQNCNNTTNHKVVAHSSWDSRSIEPNEYHYGIEYYMVQCMGCETTFFRKEEHDYEAYWQTDEDEYEHSISVDIYPHFIKNHHGLKSFWDVPEVVKNIYKESLLAIQEEAFTLASLGLRATIEAICNDKNISGANLQKRINKMKTEGLISNKDAQRLHGIRFMGNDAAHEIKKANKKSVLVALEIIEHLITSLYLFDSETSTYLETSIDDFETFIKILQKNIKNFSQTEIITLKRWLGNDERRITEERTLSTLESELTRYITDGKFQNVELEAVITNNGKSIQTYKIVVIQQAVENAY